MERLDSKRSNRYLTTCAAFTVAFLATLSFASTASAWGDSYTWICHVEHGEEQSIRVTEYQSYKHLKYHEDDERGECADTCDSWWDCRDGDYCTKAKCLPDGSCDQGPVDCDDGDPCTINGCLSWKGCYIKDVPVGDPCVSDNPCVENAMCDENGSCVGSPVAGAGCCTTDSDCDDGNGCTIDICNSNNTCETEPETCAPPADVCIQRGECRSLGPDAFLCPSQGVRCNAGPCKEAHCEVPDGLCSPEGWLCVEEDLVCPPGETCDPRGSGVCEPVGGDECPCWDGTQGSAGSSLAALWEARAPSNCDVEDRCFDQDLFDDATKRTGASCTSSSEPALTTIVVFRLDPEAPQGCSVIDDAGGSVEIDLSQEIAAVCLAEHDAFTSTTEFGDEEDTMCGLPTPGEAPDCDPDACQQLCADNGAPAGVCLGNHRCVCGTPCDGVGDCLEHTCDPGDEVVCTEFLGLCGCAGGFPDPPACEVDPDCDTLCTHGGTCELGGLCFCQD